MVTGGTTKRNGKLLALTAQLLCGVAVAGIAAAPARAADSYDIRVMTLNIWNKFKQNPELTADFMAAANFDVLGMQEVNGSTYVTRIPDFLQTAGRGTYGNVQVGDVGIISRLPGKFGTIKSGRKYARSLCQLYSAGRPGLPSADTRRYGSSRLCRWIDRSRE
ncbi:hypothetical protein Q644_05665 [Brucella intermedia 229E]|uniref:Endonuclease/exonuclease/phosphatase domain-containing protein n=1 Tax=Brucella intermedia 229E TaxID=1337887 RepID=U4VC42_9HYPH|nr:hypothetical protein Q644_05665 [Brucella intermedia 229E]